MTPAEVRAARDAIGLTQKQLATVMGLRGPATVAEWEREAQKAGSRKIGPTAARLLAAYVTGYRPEDWPKEG